MSFALKALKVLIVALAGLVILASLGAMGSFVFMEHRVAEFTSGGDPVQFYRKLDANLLDDYSKVFSIAHNSGDSTRAAREALSHGADVIEIDVVYVDGELYAAHQSPLRFIGDRFFRGPSLSEVWDAAVQADVIKLDLKNSHSEVLEALVQFLNAKRSHEVIITSRDVTALRFFSEEASQVIRLYSVPNETTLEVLLDNNDLLDLIDGITIKHGALDTTSAALLGDMGKIILVWTVNEVEDLNDLVALGVDGIITDNLAIMELLGGQQRGEFTLRSLVMRNPSN